MRTVGAQRAKRGGILQLYCFFKIPNGGRRIPSVDLACVFTTGEGVAKVCRSLIRRGGRCRIAVLSAIVSKINHCHETAFFSRSLHQDFRSGGIRSHTASRVHQTGCFSGRLKVSVLGARSEKTIRLVELSLSASQQTELVLSFRQILAGTILKEGGGSGGIRLPDVHRQAVLSVSVTVLGTRCEVADGGFDVLGMQHSVVQNPAVHGRACPVRPSREELKEVDRRGTVRRHPPSIPEHISGDPSRLYVILASSALIELECPRKIAAAFCVFPSDILRIRDSSSCRLIEQFL
jgi:hypothetical protein